MTISAYTQPTHLIFGTVIDIVNIFYHTENQVAGLCVGGDMDFIFWFVPWSNWSLTAHPENFKKNHVSRISRGRPV